MQTHSLKVKLKVYLNGLSMSKSEFDIYSFQKGTITAPAGCGKTHLILGALEKHQDEKPILVLTHTNAGVAALKHRIQKFEIQKRSYSITTIDGFCLKLVSTFPANSKLTKDTLNIKVPKTDYPLIRTTTQKMLQLHFIIEIIKATYSRVIVDEYQDCTALQHAMIKELSNHLPICVLGDPLQAIFTFGDDKPPNWNNVVCRDFPIQGELTIPWRWKNAGAEKFGVMLLEIRKKLLKNEAIDLSLLEDHVEWIQLSGANSDFALQIKAAGTNGPHRTDSVLIIGDSRNERSRYKIAGAVHGTITVEAVELKDLIGFANTFDLKDPNLTEKVILFAGDVMTNVGAADLIKRVATIVEGRSRKDPTKIELFAVSLFKNPSYQNVSLLLSEISADAAVRTYRPTVLRACYRALQICSANPNTTLLEAALKIRDENRVVGRQLPKRAIGSTLLLKGLEAEVAVILDADSLDAKNFYVAMTRGSKKLVICSKASTLNKTT